MKRPNRKTSKPTNPQKKEFQLSGEWILCLLICIISLLALTQFLNRSRDHSPTVYTPPNPHHHTERMSLMTEPVKQDVVPLKVVGPNDAGEVLTFHVPKFHGSVHYEFDLGNGKTLEATEASIRYAYPRPGGYKVKLWGTYHGRKKLVGDKRLTIEKAIAVADDAFVEVDE